MFLTDKFLINLSRRYNEHPFHASQNLSILFLVSQLPNLDCYCHWKSLHLRNIQKTFKAGFDEKLRNIQAEARKFVSYKIVFHYCSFL